MTLRTFINWPTDKTDLSDRIRAAQMVQLEKLYALGYTQLSSVDHEVMKDMQRVTLIKGEEPESLWFIGYTDLKLSDAVTGTAHTLYDC